MIREPKRLRRTEQGPLRAGLEQAHAGLPNPEQLEALAQRLRQAGIALPPETRDPGVGSRARISAQVGPQRSSLLVRVGLALAIAGVGALPWLLRGRSPVALVAPVAPGPSTLVTVGVLPVAEPALPALSSASARPHKPGSSAPAVASGPVSAEEPQPAAAAPVPSPENTPAEPRSASTAVKRTASAQPPSRPAPTAGLSPMTAQRPPADSSAELPERPALESELDLLKQARNALSGDPLAAYGLSERCAREFPRGTFAQEREFIAISALHRLGRDQEAERRAAGFRGRYPRSAYLPQLERMFGGAGVP